MTREANIKFTMIIMIYCGTLAFHFLLLGLNSGSVYHCSSDPSVLNDNTNLLNIKCSVKCIKEDYLLLNTKIRVMREGNVSHEVLPFLQYASQLYA
jgi:hypothetical protein